MKKIQLLTLDKKFKKIKLVARSVKTVYLKMAAENFERHEMFVSAWFTESLCTPIKN